MPRDGTETYILPFPDVVEDTTIESAVYNGFTNDVAQDLNTPRPVKFGGTGADNPADAMQNLGGELAKYQISNYDSDPFQAGSFYSNAGATAAPNGNAFIGICYVAVVSGSPTTDMFIEARDRVTGTMYVRQKKANVWQGWTIPAGFSTSPTPPTGAAPNTMWWDNTRGKLFIYYLDPGGAPAQWVEAVAVPDIDVNTFVEIAGDIMTGPLTLSGNAVNALHAVPKQQLDALLTNTATGAVSYTVQAPTAAQQTVARQNIYAAPFDAMAYSGMQTNGSMEVSQERGTATTAVNASFACDGWRLAFAGTMTPYAGIAANFTSGFPSYVYASNSTAQPSLGAGDYVVLIHAIEGYRFSRMAWGGAGAQPITIAFWSNHSFAGVYGGAVRNGLNNRSYAFTYTQSAAATPQYNIITIPGDTTGTWAVDNTAGISIIFAMACGTTNAAPSANTWLAGSYIAAPGQINGVSAINSAFRITGVVVLPGIEAPSAARSPLIMRPYDQELVTCMRYFEKLDGVVGMGHCQSTTQAYIGIRHLPKRATPTIANNGAMKVYTSAGAAVAVTSLVGTFNVGTTGGLFVAGTSGLTLGAGTEMFADPGTFLQIDARL